VIRIALVSPIPAVRAGLRVLVGHHPEMGKAPGAEYQVVAEAARLEELEIFPPEVDVLVISDPLNQPAVPLAELEAVAGLHPGQVSLLMLTEQPPAGEVLSQMSWRGWGLLLPGATAEELQAGIGAIAEGLWVATPALVQHSLQRVLTSASEPVELVNDLTDREIEVLQLLAQGLANKQIALALHISEHTVKFHVSSIYARMGVTNRTEAVRKGVLQGIILL
jgi:DNA-binding NarL/FixJ family response regulator